MREGIGRRVGWERYGVGWKTKEGKTDSSESCFGIGE